MPLVLFVLKSHYIVQDGIAHGQVNTELRIAKKLKVGFPEKA